MSVQASGTTSEDSENGKGENGKGSPSPKESMSSTNSGDISSVLSPHYDASKDVILRSEFLTGPQMKALVLSIWGAVLVGLGLLAMGLDLKVDKDPDYFVQDRTVPTINVVFASILLAAAFGTLVQLLRRVLRANATGKRWSMRRKRAVGLSVFELSLQVINLVFFLLPNAYVLARGCGWFDSTVLWSGAVRWTCWNTIFIYFWVQAHNSQPATNPRLVYRIKRFDAAVLDAPIWVHWPKLGPWLVFEGVLLGLTGYLDHMNVASKAYRPPGTEDDCTEWQYNCSLGGPALGLVIALQVLIVAYAVIYVLSIRRSFKLLNKLPYKQFRMANFIVRLQVRLRLISFLFFILCTVVYLFVHIGSCSSFISSWLGFLPMQFVMTCIAISGAFMVMPKKPGEMGILEVWLQEFAWTEKDVQRKRQERSSSLPKESYEHFCMDCEPMFCFETAVKMMYWSYLCYDQGETKASPFNIDTALSLYELEHFEMFWEKTLDTKAIMGWNDSTIVIAFRGTASLANVRADVQAWRTPYPAGTGNCCLGTRPMVHTGFHCAWFANKFNEKLISRLEQVLQGCTKQQADAGTGKNVNVYVTGHSLGGALATLCAFDIRQRCSFAAYTTNIKVYTFGAPRTGNHAFARLYNEALPDTWHVINNDDVVTRGGKFLILYKRAGHRVLINRRGDMVVRPSFVEASIRQGVPGGGSVRDHLLTSYQKAMVAVVQAQFGMKSFQDGKDGVLSLAAEQGTRAALKVAGLAVDELNDLASNGASPRVSSAPSSVGGSGKWKRLLLSMKRSSSTGSTASSGSGNPSHGKPGTARSTSQQLEAVVVVDGKVEDTGSPGGARPGVSPEPSRTDLTTMSEEGGVLHGRCTRKRRQRKCGTVCSLMEHARVMAGAKTCRAVANPMADPSLISRSPSATQAANQDLPEAVQQGLGLDLGMLPQGSVGSPPTSPHGPLNSTRGDVAEQPMFDLVLRPTTSASSVDLRMLEAVAEEEEGAAAAAEVGGGGEQDGGGRGEGPLPQSTTAPAVVVMR
ncbi:hypothetical protein N2152v2_004771 [Parachlorella kessleri]